MAATRYISQPCGMHIDAHSPYMYMINTAFKQYLLLLAVTILPWLCSAQVEAIDTAGIAALRQTTTVFIIPESDSSLRSGYEQAINSSWTLTPHIFITADRLADYVDKPGYSFFAEICMGKLPQNKTAFDMPVGGSPGVALAGGIIGGVISGIANQAIWFRQSEEGRLLGVPRGYYSIYTLFIPKHDDKGRYLQPFAMVKKGIAKGDAEYAEAFRNLQKKSGKQPHADSLKPDPYWNFYWTPGLLKTYLLLVNNDLATTSGLHPYTDTIDTAALARLRADTLYIPDYFRPAIMPEGEDHTDSTKAMADFARVYPYPVRFLSQHQLSDLIMTGVNVNFVTYTVYHDFERLYDPGKKNNAGAPVSKSVTIYNSKQGVIYSQFTKFSDGHPKLKGIGHQSARHPFTLYDMNLLAEVMGRNKWEQ